MVFNPFFAQGRKARGVGSERMCVCGVGRSWGQKSAPVQWAQHLETLERNPAKGVNPSGKVTWLGLQLLTTLSGHVFIDSRGVEPDPKHHSRHEQHGLGQEQRGLEHKDVF